MTWLLRRAGVDDLSAIMAIENQTFDADAWAAETMRHELESAHSYYLVAAQLAHPTQIDGYGGLMAPSGAEQADIQTLAVAESARRRGLGRTIMLQLITQARQRGATEIFLEVRADNPAAAALYDELGFERIAVRKSYYRPDNVDAIVMRHRVVTPTAGLALGAES